MSARPDKPTPTAEQISAARRQAAEIYPVFHKAELATWDSAVADDGRIIQVLVITTPDRAHPLHAAPVAASAFAEGESVPLSGAVDSGDRSVVHRKGPDIEFEYWTVVEQGDEGLHEIGVCHVFGRAGPLASSVRLRGATGDVPTKRVAHNVFGLAFRPTGETTLEVLGLQDRLRGTVVVECDPPAM